MRHCLNDLSLPNEDLFESISTFTEPVQDLLEWCVGGPPDDSYDCYGNIQPITQCSRLIPVRDSPFALPLEEQKPTNDFSSQQYHNDNAVTWYGNGHIIGLGISVSGSCGLPNETFHSGCVVCGKSYTDMKEEITLGYLEQTHFAGETYDHRIARRDAFQAGMKAGSLTLVPRGVSQTAACDGTHCQVMLGSNKTLPSSGVLPV